MSRLISVRTRQQARAPRPASQPPLLFLTALSSMATAEKLQQRERQLTQSWVLISGPLST